MTLDAARRREEEHVGSGDRGQAGDRVWLESRAGPGLRQLAGGGVKLAINGLDAARLERTAEELRAATGTEITAVAADVTTAEGQKKLVAGLDLSSGARAGLTALLAGVARQVAHADVTINNLLPGFFDTDRCRACNEATAKLQGKTVETGCTTPRSEPLGR
jgi:3-oxoacyl-[acyl-carrier protein] reductase